MGNQNCQVVKKNKIILSIIYKKVNHFVATAFRIHLAVFSIVVAVNIIFKGKVQALEGRFDFLCPCLYSAQH